MSGVDDLNGLTTLAADPLLLGVRRVRGVPFLDPCALLDVVGGGGAGKVYLGYHLNLHQLVAVKCMRLGGGMTDDAVARFKKEAALAARFRSGNIVRVMDVRKQDGLHYIVMDLIDGESVHEYIKRVGPLSAGAACRLVSLVANGIAEMHQSGIIHRDIKPSNLFLDTQGRVWVGDLGIAKDVTPEATMMTAQTAIIGTPQYMPAEQFDGRVVAASDVYSLALSLLFMLRGSDPVAGDGLTVVMKRVIDGMPDPATLVPGLPEPVTEVLRRATALKADERYQNAGEFGDALRSALRSIDDKGGLPSLPVSREFGSQTPSSEDLQTLERAVESGDWSGVAAGASSEALTMMPGASPADSEAVTIVPGSGTPPPTGRPVVDSGIPQTLVSQGGPQTPPPDSGGARVVTGPEHVAGGRGVPVSIPVGTRSAEPQRKSRAPLLAGGGIAGVLILAAGAITVLYMTGILEFSPDEMPEVATLDQTSEAESPSDEPEVTETTAEGARVRPSEMGEVPSGSAAAGPEESAGDGAGVGSDATLPEQGRTAGGSDQTDAAGETEPPPTEVAGSGREVGDAPVEAAPSESERAGAQVSRGIDEVEALLDAQPGEQGIAASTTSHRQMLEEIARLEAMASEVDSFTERTRLMQRARGLRSRVVREADRNARAQGSLDLGGSPEPAMPEMTPEIAGDLLVAAEAGSDDSLRLLITSLQWYPDGENAEIRHEYEDILLRAHDLAKKRNLAGAYSGSAEFEAVRRGSVRGESNFERGLADLIEGYRKGEAHCAFRLGMFLLDPPVRGDAVVADREFDRVRAVVGGWTDEASRRARALALLEEGHAGGSIRATRGLGHYYLTERELGEAMRYYVDCARRGHPYAIDVMSQYCASEATVDGFPKIREACETLRREGVLRE